MKYKNLTDTQLFGFYKDPYRERRFVGEMRPKSMEYKSFSFKREFKKDKLYISWMGHSSVFLHMNGLNILIDPIFSKYAAPLPIPMLKRFMNKVPKPQDFLKIDVILITHNHWDHLDSATLRSLNNQTDRFICPKGVGKYIRMSGIKKDKILELSWEEEVQIQDVVITCLPTQHGSARFGMDSNTSLWCSYLIRNEKFKVYDTGDGGYTDSFKSIFKKYGAMDVTLSECGQYNQRWHGFHMFPEESVQACLDLHTGLAIPIHHSGFILSDHAWNEPVTRFIQRSNEVNLPVKNPIYYEMLEIDYDSNY